jgi:hypothetical protein
MWWCPSAVRTTIFQQAFEPFAFHVHGGLGVCGLGVFVEQIFYGTIDKENP